MHIGCSSEGTFSAERAARYWKEGSFNWLSADRGDGKYARHELSLVCVGDQSAALIEEALGEIMPRIIAVEGASNADYTNHEHPVVLEGLVSTHSDQSHNSQHRTTVATNESTQTRQAERCIRCGRVLTENPETAYCPQCATLEIGVETNIQKEKERTNESRFDPQQSSSSDSRNEANASATPTCPRCGKPMKLRTARQGANRGNQFWGCSSFPICRGILPFEQ